MLIIKYNASPSSLAFSALISFGSEHCLEMQFITNEQLK